ncbi:MAG: rhodanese-like domain-containing protein [Candidatus Nanopelagicales bacterium]|jgi:rhodanese-related sulfurtransferase|nr:rhodanese-like domain-containing protein [Candidatus Nanopelagicales bacterium]
MRRLLALLAILLGTTALLAGCASSDAATTSSSVENVSTEAFLTTAAEPGTVIVDVRTPGEYAAGHMAGAVNIDVESPDFGAQIAGLPKDTQYAVYCRSGRRSALATDQMAAAGFTALVNLEGGGVADLQAAGAPIVTG